MTWLAAGLLVGLLAGLWAWQSRGAEPSAAAALSSRAAGADGGAERSVERARSLAQLRLLASLARAAQHEASTAAPDPSRVPHPITDEHRRLYRDLDLLHAAEQAIDEARFTDARELLLTHRRELPGMSPQEAEGLWLLVDCVERPSASNTTRVQTFYDEHTGSTVRRRLRRSCLERTR